MTSIRCSYAGDLRCEAVHGPSASELSTDAPTDNHGRGEAFSPTDLVAAALASCALTTMAIKGPQKDIALESGSARVVKHMTTEGPRAIRELEVDFVLPESLSFVEREALQQIARGCPVAISLGAEVGITMRFEYR